MWRSSSSRNASSALGPRPPPRCEDCRGGERRRRCCEADASLGCSRRTTILCSPGWRYRVMPWHWAHWLTLYTSPPRHIKHSTYVPRNRDSAHTSPCTGSELQAIFGGDRTRIPHLTRPKQQCMAVTTVVQRCLRRLQTTQRGHRGAGYQTVAGVEMPGHASVSPAYIINVMTNSARVAHSRIQPRAPRFLPGMGLAALLAVDLVLHLLHVQRGRRARMRT